MQILTYTSYLGVFWTLACPAFADLQGSPGAINSTTTNPNSTTGATQTTSWQDEPNGRGTFSLVVSCLLTLTLCVWSALHLNVPAQNTSLRSRILEKTKWVLYGIFAPELVVATAAAQFIAARWLKRQIELDAKYRIEKGQDSKGMSTHTWTLSQCFYAVMGGFAAHSPWVDFRSRSQPYETDDSGNRIEHGLSDKNRVAITAEGVRLLSFLGRLPHIEESQIQDKSKADWMAKSLICIQVGWMVVQVLARAIKQMPISLLEINTCGHVACAMAIYLLWWSKPLEIQEPTLLDGEEREDALALMYMSSSIGAVNGITDLRCFIHVATEQDERYWLLPSHATTNNTIRPIADDLPEEVEITTHLSTGSPGLLKPSKFLGFQQLRFGKQDLVNPPKKANHREQGVKGQKNSFTYKLNSKNPNISKDCQVYYLPPYTDDPMPSLRHSYYCRRWLQVQEDALRASGPTSTKPKPPSSSPHIPVPVDLLTSASKAADSLRSECSEDSRPSYKKHYFTYLQPSLGDFIGETEYIVRERIANFPSLQNLSLGQVDIHRDRLRSVLALTAAAYGALHCAGWSNLDGNSPKSKLFPTHAEVTLWIISSLTVAASGAILWGFYLAREFWPAFDRWVSGVAPGEYIENELARQQRRKLVNKIIDATKKWTVWGVLILFALARIYLVVEAFVSLRMAPVGLYDTPEWTDFLPHF